MNRFFTLLLAAFCLTAVGQVTYPYNPDGNADSLIGVTDLQDLLSTYGGAFSPSEIQIDGVGLGEVLTQLLTIQAEMQGTISALEAENLAHSVHGHFNILSGDSVSWIVPSGVQLVEVKLSGSNGGQGQGTNYCSWAYGGSAVSGCGGAVGGQARLMVQVTLGDTITIHAGATPPPPPPGPSPGDTGTVGNPSQLFVNGLLVAIATGGGGGKGYYCQGGTFYSSCSSNPQPNPIPGVFIGPTIDSGAILLESGTGGGGNCVLRY